GALLRHPPPAHRVGDEGLGTGGEDDARSAAAPRHELLQADGGDRVRSEVRRRGRRRPGNGRDRARGCVADLEDAALDLPRLPRVQGGERTGREGHRAAGGAVRDRPVEDRRADDRRGAAGRDPLRSGHAAGGGQSAPPGGGRDRPQARARWRWGEWGVLLLVAGLVFYFLLAPIWVGLRVAAWVAEFRARQRKN